MKKKHLLSIAIAIACTVLLYLFFRFTGALYTDLDNYFIAQVLSGAYGAQNWCLHVNPILAFVTGFLSKLNGRVDWYTLLVHAFILFAIFHTVAFSVWNDAFSTKKKCLLIAWVVFSTICLGVWNANYTVQSSFLTANGTVLLFSKQQEQTRRTCRFWYAVGTIMLCFGAMLRIEAFLLFTPFFMVLIFRSVFNSKKDVEIPNRRIVLSIFIALVCAYGLVVMHAAVKHLPKYIEAAQYDAARVSVVDYPLKDWQEVKEETSIQEIDYIASSHWFLLDTDVQNTEQLNEIARVGSRTLSLEEIGTSLKTTIGQNKLHIFGLVCMSGVVFLLLISNKKRSDILFSVILFLGMLLIILYFERKGRAPLRVWDSVWLSCMAAQLAICEVNNTKKTKYLFWAGMLGIGLILYMNVSRESIRKPQNLCESRSGNEFAVYENINDGINVWEDFHGINSVFYMYEGKLMPESFLAHNISKGDWLYGQVYYREYWKKLGIDNPLKVLIDNEESYYIAESPDFIIQLIKSHYGIDVEAIDCGHFNQCVRWKLVEQ